MTSTAPAGTSGVPASVWDPRQYEQFGSERARPFHDLLAQVDVPAARRVADLGCGTGALTAALLDLWPGAVVVGVDRSPEMLAEALPRAVDGRLEFQLGDVRTWEPAEPLDVIVSNATLQWVPDHLPVIERLASFLNPGGELAIQVPGNFSEPTHRLLADVAARPRWSSRLEGALERPASHDPATYLEVLLGTGLQARAWETTYCQLLQGGDAVLEWMKGTALRPVLSALEDSEREEFLSEYGSLLRTAYPEGEHGTLLPFRRIFALGRRPGTTHLPAVTGLDHAQLAIPEGGEEAGRHFYGGLLALTEVPKPPVLAARGGCWFSGHGVQLHLGIEADFRPATKAHVGLVVTDLDGMARRLTDAGHRVAFDDNLAPRRHFFTDDPFGNRLEILERV